MNSKSYLKVGWEKYFDLSNPTINKYLKTKGLKFIEQSIIKIKNAYNKKIPFFILIKFEDEDIISILYENEYETALKKLLDLCIEFEYYELCIDIDLVLNKMKKRKRRRVGNVFKKNTVII